jgi:hypothetical protein
MANLILNGSTSGSVTLSSPAVSGTTTLTLPASTGNVVTDTATQTLTNKTLTSPTITGASITVASTEAPTFSAYASTTTTLSANTWTKVNYATEDWDTNSNFASSRFTPTVAGYYQINAAFGEGLSTANMVFYIEIEKNGAPFRRMQYITTPTGWYTNVNISAMVYCNGTTDYIEIYAYTGAAYTNNASILNYFDGAMVRSA